MTTPEAPFPADDPRNDFLVATTNRIREHIAAEEFIEAHQLCRQVMTVFAEDAKMIDLAQTIENDCLVSLSHKAFKGPRYTEWLQWLHRRINPACYVEIGIAGGDTLVFPGPDTEVIGIDPAFTIATEIVAPTRLIRQESDRFFASDMAERLFARKKIDLAFIDGLHTFDQALRDFINVERNAAPGAVVAFHDIYPLAEITARRERVSRFWLGDTWKVIPILRAYRPDLQVITLPALPSGLALVTGLDPASSLLAELHDAIVAEFMPLHLDAIRHDQAKLMNLVENDFNVGENFLAGRR